MVGNVMEWTDSLYWGDHPYRRDQAANDPESATNRAVRGGTCGYEPHDSRATYRTGGGPRRVDLGIGMRLALGAPNESL